MRTLESQYRTVPFRLLMTCIRIVAVSKATWGGHGRCTLAQFILSPTLMTSLIHLGGPNGMEMKAWTLYIMESMTIMDLGQGQRIELLGKGIMWWKITMPIISQYLSLLQVMNGWTQHTSLTMMGFNIEASSVVFQEIVARRSPN